MYGPLNTAEFFVSLLSKLTLHPNHRFEARVEEWYAKIEELGQFGNKLLVQHIEYLLGVVVFLLRLNTSKRLATWIPKNECMKTHSG